jgi:hypothetical protein
VRAFLNRVAGVASNDGSGSEQDVDLRRELEKARARIGRQERRIKRLRKRLSNEKPVEAQRGASLAKADTAGTPVFFVVGQGKSGTGWLQKTLDFHPEVLCSGEGKFFGREKRNETLIDAQAGNKFVQRKVPPARSTTR